MPSKESLTQERRSHGLVHVLVVLRSGGTSIQRKPTGFCRQGNPTCLTLNFFRQWPSPASSLFAGDSAQNRFERMQGPPKVSSFLGTTRTSSHTRCISQRGASCCDLGLKRPCKAIDNQTHECMNVWHWNGSNEREMNDQPLQRHSVLWNYSLVRLKEGVGLVTLAASNFGQQCLPNDNTNGKRRDFPLNDDA